MFDPRTDMGRWKYNLYFRYGAVQEAILGALRSLQEDRNPLHSVKRYLSRGRHYASTLTIATLRKLAENETSEVRPKFP